MYGDWKDLRLLRIFYAIVEHPRVKLLFFRLGWGPLEIFPGRWLRRKPAITNVPTPDRSIAALPLALCLVALCANDPGASSALFKVDALAP